MLVDTGATFTCMSLDVARELQLSPADLRGSYGAGGLHENEVFEAFLTAPIRWQIQARNLTDNPQGAGYAVPAAVTTLPHSRRL